MDPAPESSGGTPQAGAPAPGATPGAAGTGEGPGSGAGGGAGGAGGAPGGGGAGAGGERKSGVSDSYAGLVVWGIIGIVVAGFYLVGVLRGMEELEIVAAAQLVPPPTGAPVKEGSAKDVASKEPASAKEPAPKEPASKDAEAPKQRLQVSGIVVWDGEPVEGARVWAVAGTDSGNRAPIASKPTQADGTFKLDPVDATVGDQEISSVQVYATGTRPAKASDGKKADSGTKLRGREIIRTGKGVAAGTVSTLRTRRVAPPGSLIALLGVSVVCFFMSLGAASSRVPAATRYFLSLALAFVLMVAMWLALAMGMMYVSTRGMPGDVFSFGFASVVCGAPSGGAAREWMFSFTTPESDGAKGGLTGFYAPLWVMLLAVLGAGLLTLSLLLTEIRNPPNLASDDDDVRRRIQNIVMHQFFTLFSPLGAIFVYQALLMAKAASEPVAVAIAALGAGASLNALLKVAVDRTTRLFEAPSGAGALGGGGREAGAGSKADQGGKKEPAAVSLAETKKEGVAGTGAGKKDH